MLLTFAIQWESTDWTGVVTSMDEVKECLYEPLPLPFSFFLPLCCYLLLQCGDIRGKFS